MKRYKVTAEFYLFAKSDDDALRRVENWRRGMDKKMDNSPKIIEIFPSSFGNFDCFEKRKNGSLNLKK